MIGVRSGVAMLRTTLALMVFTFAWNVSAQESAERQLVAEFVRHMTALDLQQAEAMILEKPARQPNRAVSNPGSSPMRFHRAFGDSDFKTVSRLIEGAADPIVIFDRARDDSLQFSALWDKSPGVGISGHVADDQIVITEHFAYVYPPADGYVK
ncbi:MAG: hypothetical protein HLUCCX21_04805 [Porphyrobacter sp. HL-46]|nr:MAG: hypothetical protein HLUCCX21_04805 [Porphyrobacter sp. HL-46]